MTDQNINIYSGLHLKSTSTYLNVFQYSIALNNLTKWEKVYLKTREKEKRMYSCKKPTNRSSENRNKIRKKTWKTITINIWSYFKNWTPQQSVNHILSCKNSHVYLQIVARAFCIAGVYKVKALIQWTKRNIV